MANGEVCQNRIFNKLKSSFIDNNQIDFVPTYAFIIHVENSFFGWEHFIHMNSFRAGFDAQIVEGLLESEKIFQSHLLFLIHRKEMKTLQICSEEEIHFT